MTPSDVIQLAGVISATVLSIAAIIISARANRAVQRFSERQYLGERRIAVASTMQRGADATDRLWLVPTGSDQTINNVTLFFPRRIRQSPMALAAGNLCLGTPAVEYDLRAYWDERTPAIAGQAAVRENVPVPVGVRVHGFTKGDAVLTEGLYDLYCRYIRVPDRPSSLTLLSLTFNNWIDGSGNLQDAVDHALAAYESASRQESL